MQLREHSQNIDSAEKTTPEGHQKIIRTLSDWFPHISAETLQHDHLVEIQSKVLSVPSNESSPLEIIVQLISSVVIIFEHSFYVFDKRRYLQDEQGSNPSFHIALEQYMASPHAAAVEKSVNATVHAYEKAAATAAKEKEYLCRQAKEELIKAVLEIALNHRLTRP